jgi:predicted RNase H-like HicB family nuclease
LHLGNVHLRGTIPAAIYRGEQRYVAECPLLGIVTQGTTLEETLANLREAFEVTIEGEDPVQLGIAAGAVLLVQVEAARWDA